MIPCTTHLVPDWSCTKACSMDPEGLAVSLSSFSHFRYHNAGGATRERNIFFRFLGIPSRRPAQPSSQSIRFSAPVKHCTCLAGAAATSSIFLNGQGCKNVTDTRMAHVVKVHNTLVINGNRYCYYQDYASVW